MGTEGGPGDMGGHGDTGGLAMGYGKEDMGTKAPGLTSMTSVNCNW